MTMSPTSEVKRMECRITGNEAPDGCLPSECARCEAEFERGLAAEEARFEEGCRQALTITEENSY